MNRLLMLLILLNAFACHYKTEGEENLDEPDEMGSYIYLRDVDNQAKIYVNDSLIFTSKMGKKGDYKEERVDLNPSLHSGKNEVRVDLINGDPNAMGFDKNWSLYYELFRDMEPVDYVNEQSESGGTGVVFSKTHTIEIQP